MRKVTIVAIVVAVVALVAARAPARAHTIGLQMRAAATDFGTARLLGVRAERGDRDGGAALGACIAAAVAVLLTVQNPLVDARLRAQ